MIIDAKGILIDGKVYTVKILPDDDVTPDDYDCFGSEGTEAFLAGEWRFVGVVVEDDKGRNDSLWAVAYGAFPGVDPITLDTLIAQPYAEINGVDLTLPETLAYGITP